MSAMNPGAGPDAIMTDPAPMTIAQIRDTLDLARDLISDTAAYHDGVYVDSEYIDGKEICERLREAESRLWVIEAKMKEQGA